MFQTKPKGFLAVPKPIQNKKTKESFVGNYLPDFTFIVNTLRREKTIRTSNGSNPKEKKQRKFPQNSHWTVESDDRTDSSFWHRQYSFLRCLMGLLKYLGGGWEFGFMVYVFGKGICASRSSPRNVWICFAQYENASRLLRLESGLVEGIGSYVQGEAVLGQGFDFKIVNLYISDFKYFS